MADQNDYGNRLGNAFGLKNPPTLATQTLLKGTLAVTQLAATNRTLG
jgi:hypothetical protein